MDLGLELGVEVMGRVVVAAGILVMAYDGGLGVVRVPEAMQGVGGEPLGVEMPRVVGDSVDTAPLLSQQPPTIQHHYCW